MYPNAFAIIKTKEHMPHFKHSKKNQKGFTLIELLIVISIIGILSGVLLSVIDPRGTQKKARDAQRISELSTVKVALGLYFADYGLYVSTSGDWESIQDVLTVPIQGIYIDKLPDDPLSTQDYKYTSPTGGASYIMTAALELPNDVSGDCSTSPHASGNCYAVSGY